MSVERAGTRTLAAFVELSKPGVLSLVLLTMLCGALVAPGHTNAPRLLIAFLGTALVVASANALNMYIERDSDALMSRTKGRPLPTGRLTPEAVLWFALVLGLVGLFVLAVWVNVAAFALTSAALLSYVLAYTPLKRTTSLALQVGAVPGAIPPLIGWASTTGSLAPRAFVLFAILFVWQLPHFLAIAVFRREEYARAGLVVLPNAHGMGVTRFAIVRYSVLLLAVSVAPVLLGMAGPVYALVVGVLGTAYLAYAGLGYSERTPERWARLLFFASMPYLIVVFVGLVVSAKS
jgi:heme o synthase